jgi:hypothetical protein
MAKKYPIWLVKDAELCYHNVTKNAIPFYTFDIANRNIILRKDAELASIDDLAELCDMDAEQENAHTFVGVHQKLADLLVKRLGKKAATQIMLDIAYHKGLHTMNGGG